MAHGLHPRIITMLVVAMGVAGCSSDAGTSSPGGDAGGGTHTAGRIEGTATLPADATGRCALVALDTDTTGSNGSARRADGTYLQIASIASGSEVGFVFDGAPAGPYFLWGYVDVDRSASSPPGNCELTGGPNSGDYLGYYDTGLVPPSAANVQVPGPGSGTWDFQLGVFP